MNDVISLARLRLVVLVHIASQTRRVLRSAAVVSIALTIITGCASIPRENTKYPELEEPRATPLERVTAIKPTVALVLSGGAARGFAHIGVLKVLEANGIRPDLIVGTSAGSIVGALYAGGLNARDIEKLAYHLDWSLLGDLTIPGLGFIGGNRIEELVNEKLRYQSIEALPIPFAVVATEVQTGRRTVFNRGNPGKAVRASASLPGIFSPVLINGRYYTDGGLVSPLPVLAARQMGADIVIGVDVMYRPSDSALWNPLSMLFQAFLIAAYRLTEIEGESADLVITPSIPSTSGQYFFSARAMLIEIGEQAAAEALPKIKALVSHRGTATSGQP